ncbi:NAD(P)H-hydrate epimerase [Rhodohalobacter sp. 614A]|uniref:NAD(P)H-hydrate epimerase n=1 Tax=Rhodohalobacter sp. 614A TaxID=2908649 RepID=UPI001F327460|nr:NAD(P)H-hydrate epimerase [Rhodohalobacter sp. 614A]
MTNSFSIPVECQLSTAEQSREMDSKTINEFGIDGFTLMEIAASSAASHIKNLQGNEKSGLFVCGKGNNAGDALAVARYLINDSQHKVAIWFVLGDDDLSRDAEKNLTLLKKLKKKGARVEYITELESLDEGMFDYIVDGIFGTGLNSDLRGNLPQIIKKINAFSLPVYSMDVPSGLHADSGEILKECVKADYTFTFGSNKIGLHWKKSREYTGKVVFCNLPFPSTYRNWDAVLINQTLMESIPEVKRKARHKYDGGVVHIMAGSAGLTGAAIMSAKSAWKQGAGAVFLYAPKALLSTYESALPNIIKVGVGKESDTHFKEEHAEAIVQSVKNKKGVLLAGPGIGTTSETGKCLLSVLEQHQGFTILDADALSFWDILNESKISKQQKQNWLLTPHIGEASNYLDGEFSNDYERFEWAKRFVSQSQSSLLMKGNPTILSFINGNNFVTGYDTSMFSRAGFGDVLSGALASFTAITENSELASVSALYNGYKKFHKHQDTEPFGPEHLL